MENVICEVKMNLPSSKLSLEQAQEIISNIFPVFFLFQTFASNKRKTISKETMPGKEKHAPFSKLSETRVD